MSYPPQGSGGSSLGSGIGLAELEVPAADGAIIVGDGSGAPVERVAFASSTGALTTLVAIAGGTVTDPSTPLTVAQTWNDAADTFKAFTIAITNTNSAAASLLAEFTVGGTVMFSVSRAGQVLAAVGDAAAPGYSFVGDPNTGVFQEGADILAFTVGGNRYVNLTANRLAVLARMCASKGADVAAANDLTLGADGNYFTITGNTQINGIATANWLAGSMITLKFSGTPTVKHNTAAGAGFASLLLAGAADFVASADDTLTLVYDGTTWREIARAVI